MTRFIIPLNKIISINETQLDNFKQNEIIQYVDSDKVTYYFTLKDDLRKSLSEIDYKLSYIKASDLYKNLEYWDYEFDTGKNDGVARIYLDVDDNQTLIVKMKTRLEPIIN